MLNYVLRRSLYGVLIPTAVHVSEHVPAPYMAVIFHVPQAQASV